jgi:hypothetical protein
MKKQFIQLIGVAMLCATIVSCNTTEAKFPSVYKPAEKAGGNQILFKVNGELVKTSGWNISRFDMGRGIQLNITSNMHEEKRTIAFNINGWTPGTYSLEPFAQEWGTAYGDYKPDYDEMLNSFSFTDGEIIIESIDTAAGFLNATFHGTAKNNKGSFSISDGKIIYGRLKNGTIKYYTHDT